MEPNKKGVSNTKKITKLTEQQLKKENLIDEDIQSKSLKINALNLDSQTNSLKIETEGVEYKNPHSVIIKIVQTGLLLALAILVNFISSQVGKFWIGSFLKFDFALVILVITAQYVGLPYAYLNILLLFGIGPSYGSWGYSLPGLLGHFILWMVQMIFVTIAWSFYRMFSKNKKTSRFKYNSINIILSLISASLLTTLIITFINVYVTTPLFLKVYGQLGDLPPTVKSCVTQWDKIVTTNIFPSKSSYYQATFYMYTIFNLLSTLFNSILIAIIMVLNERARFIKKQNVDEEVY